MDHAAEVRGQPVPRPATTMPEAEQAVLRAAYARAGVILEYGAGASTIMAAEMPGKQITSVESDEAWAGMMRRYFTETPPAAGSEVDIFWADIGPTVEWGHPRNKQSYLKFPSYALEIWLDDEMPQPDVVLVDGRFRAGCALATALNTKRPVELFIDDYPARRFYRRVERWLGAPEITGRLARFDVVPMVLDPRDLMAVIALMLRPA